ncbi:abortive infection protein [Aquipluma nitroreducens]|uniref:Abortive infection protein n=1 Tax=Aquipluma nitroreducens TaxID=2010828 RepID=A0A5K7S8F2_9BACT|nr:CPBP family intramembrane glutamic endopeptidase [Aquipluma nitroreducens]BBE17832.1 abortive infection protein [Aquipluma nitroreducens]
MDFTAFRTMKPFAQLMFALFVMVASVFIFMVVGMIAAMPFYGIGSLMNGMSATSLNSPEGLSFLKYFQVIQSIGLFVAPPFAIGWLYSGNIGEYLKINRSTRVQSFLLAAISLLMVIPVINFLGAINSQMSLPESLSGLEGWMKTMEDAAKILTEKFLKVDSFGGLLFNVFMIAILPALGEELMFRGVIQRIFSSWTKNYHWGIWITAFLFSAMHMQFYGFLPRMALGAMFGYLLVWTGTMWVPILAHFVNNLMGVLGYFLIDKGTISNDIEEWGTGTEQVPLVLFSFLVVGGLLFLIYKGEQAKTKMPVNRVDSQA